MNQSSLAPVRNTDQPSAEAHAARTFHPANGTVVPNNLLFGFGQPFPTTLLSELRYLLGQFICGVKRTSFAMFTPCFSERRSYVTNHARLEFGR